MIMKQFKFAAIIVAFFVAIAGCGKIPKTGEVKMSNTTDSVSYALGYVHANGWSKRLKELPFDTLDLKAVAKGFSKSVLNEDFVKYINEQFGSFNEDIFITAFVNQLAYEKSYFNEMSADMLLQSEFQKQKARKDTVNKAKAQENLNKGNAFLEENKKRPEVITLESGLQYEVLKAAEGQKPLPTDRVKIHYHGTLIDGTVFDSSVDRGEPMVHSASGFIKGWNEALQLMSVGAKWKLYIPANLAYGERGAGENIGPNQALIFEVELLGIEENKKAEVNKK